MGCSAHNVPSLSKVATRSAGGTKSAEPCFVTRSTKSKMAFLGAVLFQDGSESVTGVCSVGEAGGCASADAGRSTDNAGMAAKADSIARRLTSKNLSSVFIFQLLGILLLANGLGSLSAS